jgi:hypothetical protein
VPRTVSGAAALDIRIDGVIAIRRGISNHFADFSQDRRDLISARGRRCVNEVAAVGVGWPDLSVRAGILIGRLGLIGTTEALIERLQSSDLRIR